jgi:hypothetical protein
MYMYENVSGETPKLMHQLYLQIMGLWMEIEGRGSS